MHCYDAELFRLRAATHEDPEDAARLPSATELARKQKAPVFALRAALDDHRCAARRRERQLRMRDAFSLRQHLAGIQPGARAAGLISDGPVHLYSTPPPLRRRPSATKRL